MENTKIHWADDTVNPTMGCNGCELWIGGVKLCYAGKLHERRGGQAGYAPTFTEVTLFPGRMEIAARKRSLAGRRRPTKPWLDGHPRLIFVSDLSDSLSKEVPFVYLESEIIDTVLSDHGRRHKWLWLTKRPGRMADFSAWLQGWGVAWPENLWAGTSVTTQATTERINHLLKVGDARTTRFISLEPQWEAVDLRPWLPQLDWVIGGGESGKLADVHDFRLEWADDMLAACRAAKVPYFLKQLGRKASERGQPLKLQDGHGADMSEWPERLRVREVPRG